MKICHECAHCLQIDHGKYIQYHCALYCKQCPILGTFTYDPCFEHNSDGECQQFEPKRKWYHWFCDKLMGL